MLKGVKNNCQKKIDKFKKEDAEIKEVLSQDYSKLNKIQKTKYDKYKQKLIDKEIELMREESSNKFFLYNEIKCKFIQLFQKFMIFQNLFIIFQNLFII